MVARQQIYVKTFYTWRNRHLIKTQNFYTKLYALSQILKILLSWTLPFRKSEQPAKLRYKSCVIPWTKFRYSFFKYSYLLAY